MLVAVLVRVMPIIPLPGRGRADISFEDLHTMLDHARRSSPATVLVDRGRLDEPGDRACSSAGCRALVRLEHAADELARRMECGARQMTPGEVDGVDDLLDRAREQYDAGRSPAEVRQR